eukprot:TRINITY_DN37308_c0_g2_i2.p1 TRINITY_DN37308_c0_g2~~TRINITY_DN37308_c0_g2_i2.p1  ORF type:complete len:522 (+),score=46.74 TRINITY_DN37308_c0_g2_i2:82-1647(+)
MGCANSTVAARSVETLRYAVAAQKVAAETVHERCRSSKATVAAADDDINPPVVGLPAQPAELPAQPAETAPRTVVDGRLAVVEQPVAPEPVRLHNLARNNNDVSSNAWREPVNEHEEPLRKSSKSVEQLTALVEHPLAVVGGKDVGLSKSAGEVPFEFDVSLVAPGLLTEVEVLSNQLAKCRRRVEVIVDGIVRMASPLCETAERRENSSKRTRCRLQLEEPLDKVKTFTVRVTDSLIVSTQETEPVEIYEVVPRGLPRGSDPPRRRLLRAPEYWMSTDVTEPKRIDMVRREEIELFQKLLDSTWKAKATRDRVGKLPVRLHVRKVQRVEAGCLWNRYSRERRRLSQLHDQKACTPVAEARGRDAAGHVRTERLCQASPKLCGPCDSRINEHYLFHGTSPHGALGIIKHGFQLSRAGERSGLLFGPGAYFAESSSKFDEYANPDEFSGMCAVLVCRVACGEMFRTLNKLDHAVLGDPKFAETYDSVLGDREAATGTYREFVVFKQEQVYPEFLVLYDREYA